jgi:hypothetical protein
MSAADLYRMVLDIHPSIRRVLPAEVVMDRLREKNASNQSRGSW